MVSHADTVTVQNTIPPLPRTERKKGAGKTPKISWGRSFSNFFGRKSVKASPRLDEERTISVAPINKQEQNVELTPGQQTTEVPPEPPAGRETLDREAEICTADKKVASGSKRPYSSERSADWPLANDGALLHVEDSRQHELESPHRVLENEMGEYSSSRPRTTGAAAKSCSNDPHERKTNNAHVLLLRQDDLSVETRLPVALLSGNANGNESNTGCLALGKTSSGKLQKVPKGKIIYSKAGGSEDDTITFEVSLNDSLMKEVLNSIQEGQIPVSLATYGRRGKSANNYLEKCASSIGPDDTSDEFSVDIELSDPVGSGVKVEGEHTNGNNAESSSPYSLLPQLVELMVRKQIGDDDGHENEDGQLRNGPLQKGTSYSKQFTELILSPISVSSNSALTSYSSHGSEIVEEEFDKGQGRNKGGLHPQNCSASAGRQSSRLCSQSSSNIVQSHEGTERKDGDDKQTNTPLAKVGMPHGNGLEHYSRDNHSTKSANQHMDRGVDETQARERKGPKLRKDHSSSNSSMEYQNSNVQKRYPSSNSSLECCRSNIRAKGRKTDRLRDRAIVRAQMKRAKLKKQRRPEAEVSHLTFCSFLRHRQRQDSSSQGTESPSARSGIYTEVDTNTMSADGRHSWEPRNGGDDKLHVRRRIDDMNHSLKYRSGGKDEELGCTSSDDETQSYKNSSYSENSSAVMFGPKRAKRAGWYSDKGADECKTVSNNQGMATGVRKYQSSCSTILSFSKSKASVGDCGDTFLENVYMSELRDASTAEDRVVEYEHAWDDNYPGSLLRGKQVNAPRTETCQYNLKDDRAYSGSGPDHRNHAGDYGNGSLSLEPADQDWDASTRNEHDDQYGTQNLEEELRIDQGPENKWLQRTGNLSLAQEPDEYNRQDGNGFTLHQTDGFLTQEPHGSYSSRDSDRPPIFSKCRSGDSQRDQTGEMPSVQQPQRSLEGCVKKHTEISLSAENKAPECHSCPTEVEVGLEDENFTRNENLAANIESKDQGMQVRTPFTPQHTANGECMVQASKSLLQNLPIVGCCHISRFGTEGWSLGSPSKDRTLGKDSFANDRDTCDLSVLPDNSLTPTGAAKNDTTENQATEDYHRIYSRSIHDVHSRELGATCSHAGPRRKETCILAGAIKSGTKEMHQPAIREEPCRHEFIGKECENEFMYSGELEKGRKDKPSFDPDGEHVKSSHVSQVFLQEVPSKDLDDLKQREASWKQCQKRYEAMLKKIQKMSEQAHSGLDLYPDVLEDTIQLDEQIQNTLTESNIADNSSKPSDTQAQELASCSCERTQQERKLPRGSLKPIGRSVGHRAGRDYIFSRNTVKSIVKRSVSDDSSSDDDIYDRASRTFRDELFKRVPRKNEESLTISSQVLTVSCRDCIDQVTRKRVHEVQRHLRDLTSSDPFRFSSVYKELLRVEHEMKEIARAFASHAHKIKSNYLDPPVSSSDSRDGQENLKSKGSEGKWRHVDGQDGGPALVDESSPELEREFSGSIYENPLWSKWMPRKTNSCGGPLSVHMAARLSDAEVPIDYENGYKVQYVPVDKRGNTGMRDKHPGWEERCRLLRVDETAEPSPLSADDSSSSSSGNPRGNPLNLQVQAPPGYDSSSSDAGSKLLHQRHQREGSKDTRCTETHKFETDSDSTNNNSWSDDDATNLELFVGEAEEQLGRLKLAKVQLGGLSPDSLARVNKLYKTPLSKTSDKTGPDHWITETYECESEFLEGPRAKRTMRQKKRTPTVATTLPLKKLTAREIKEFHLLERRVQRELGASGRNTKPANCQDQERTSDGSNKPHDHARADEVLSSCQDRSTGNDDPSQVAPTTIAGNDTSCGMTRGVSSLVEQMNGNVSSVVKLFFGAQREEPRTDEGRTANDLQGVYPMIRRKVELLEAEILHFTKGKRKFKALVKEHDEHADQFKRAKAAWEQRKASDMEAFQKFKDSQMSKLQKERTKLEQQIRSTIPKVPRKEERRAIDELKGAVAQEQETHSKKEEQWRLTSNRLRKANKELLEQINELREQIRRLEEQIFSQLDAREGESDTSAKRSGEMARERKERANIHSILTR